MRLYNSDEELDIDLLLRDAKELIGQDVQSPPTLPRKPTQPTQPTLSAPSMPVTRQIDSRTHPNPTGGDVYDGEGRYQWNQPDFTGQYDPVTPSREKVTQPVRIVHIPQEGSMDHKQAETDNGQRIVSAPPRGRAPNATSKRDNPPTKGRVRKPKGERGKEDGEHMEENQPRKKKKGKKIIVTLLLLCLVCYGGFQLFSTQPVYEQSPLGPRKDDFSTILLAGTDADGLRTDTMMLLSVDKKKGEASLISIPRDTYVYGDYNVPKLNGAYGWVGGGEDGMEELMRQVTNCIGLRPDGYVLVDLDGFIALVDAMGGVEFDVPVDMYYQDPDQNLTIDLKAGKQRLNGEQAMGLVRFRSGYAMADLERVNVQRDFVSAAANEWLGVSTVLKVPSLLSWYGEYVLTDLSVSNFSWLASGFLSMDFSTIQTLTLPGTAGYAYYSLNPYDVVEMVNAHCNPYEADITVDQLSIRN